MDSRISTLIATIAGEFAAQGATAVVLVGSHARGDAGPHSDIDLLAIGAGAPYRLERRDEHLISISWRTEDGARASYDDPAWAGAAVPAWRDAIIVLDPDGVAARLRADAHAWRWSRIDSACDTWVADEIAGLAEEVHKLRSALDRDRRLDAAIQRDVLALRLPRIAGVHLRMLYDTETAMYALVAERMGDEWRRAQSAAFSLDGESGVDSCVAALRLYVMAAAAVRHLLDPQQLAVVEHAVALAGRVR